MMTLRAAEIMAEKYRRLATDFRRYEGLEWLALKAEKIADDLLASASR